MSHESPPLTPEMQRAERVHEVMTVLEGSLGSFPYHRFDLTVRRNAHRYIGLCVPMLGLEEEVVFFRLPHVRIREALRSVALAQEQPDAENVRLISLLDSYDVPRKDFEFARHLVMYEGDEQELIERDPATAEVRQITREEEPTLYWLLDNKRIIYEQLSSHTPES